MPTMKMVLHEIEVPPIFVMVPPFVADNVGTIECVVFLSRGSLWILWFIVQALQLVLAVAATMMVEVWCGQLLSNFVSPNSRSLC